jgi:tetratricopeptide (TPR) repeat protein
MSARGREANLFQLVNTIAMEVLATQGGDARPIGRAARRSTSSLAALRSFLAGEDHFRAARYAPAVEAYQRANALDSTFALANYRLSEAADWVGNGDLMMDAVDRAFRHRNRLSLRDRMVVEATYHWRHGTIDRAELLLREVVKLYPDDAEAWYQLGEVQFHSAPARGRPISNATSAFRTALRLDSARTESLLHLARIAAIYGDHSRVDSLVSESIQRRSDATTAKLKGFAAFVHRDRQAIDRIVDSLRAIGSGDLYPLVLSAAQYATDLDAAARVAALLLDAPHEPEMRRSAAFLLASIQLARGHGDSAFRALAVIPNDAMSWGTAHRALLIEVPGAPQPSRAELLALRDSLRSWPHKIPPAVDSSKRRQSGFALNAPMFEQYPIALVSLRIGDTSAASAAARTLANQRGEVDERMLAAALAAAVEARIALIRADTVNALRLLESISPSVPLYLTGDLSGFTRERLLRARLLESRGRLREALTLYESLGQGSASGIAYAGAAMAARAALHERLGERSSAEILKARLGRTGVASRQCCVGWQTRPLTP